MCAMGSVGLYCLLLTSSGRERKGGKPPARARASGVQSPSQGAMKHRVFMGFCMEPGDMKPTVGVEVIVEFEVSNGDCWLFRSLGSVQELDERKFLVIINARLSRAGIGPADCATSAGSKGGVEKHQFFGSVGSDAFLTCRSHKVWLLDA